MLTIEEIKRILDAELLSGGDNLTEIVNGACSSDLMSDVLAFSKDHSALLTGLCNPQVIRTAEMMDMLCIIFVRGKKPDELVINMAQKRNIILLATKYHMFTASGLLYNAGLLGGNEKHER